jgi:hypothetical protein
VSLVRCRDILDQLRNFNILNKISAAWRWSVKLSKNEVYLISWVLCQGNRHCFYGMNLHSESTLVWKRSQAACSHCKFQAKSPKSFLTFNEIWIISVREKTLHEFHAKKLTAQTCPPIFTYSVKVQLPHKTFTSQLL